MDANLPSFVVAEARRNLGNPYFRFALRNSLSRLYNVEGLISRSRDVAAKTPQFRFNVFSMINRSTSANRVGTLTVTVSIAIPYQFSSCS